MATRSLSLRAFKGGAHYSGPALLPLMSGEMAPPCKVDVCLLILQAD